MYPLTYKVSVHSSCACNELSALYNRHLVDRTGIAFNSRTWKRCGREFEKLLADLPMVERCSYLDVVNDYAGRKKRMYYKAMLDVTAEPFDDKWAAVRMFVKPDKYPEAEIDDKYPRAIQYRDPRFNLLVAVYLKPFEQVFYKLERNGLPLIAKGLDNYRRAQVLCEASAEFAQPVWYLLDHSKFDSCIRTEHLKWCHRVYRRGIDAGGGLKFLLRHQLVNRGYSKNGTRYRVKGTRMSGDYDTALGNTLVNAAVLHYVSMNCRSHFFVDGDDSVLIVDRKDVGKLRLEFFEQLGFNTTIEVVHSLSEVEFCRSKLLPTRIPRLVRDPRRALSNYTVTTRYYHPKVWPRYVKGQALGELAQTRGVPVISKIMEKLAEIPGEPIMDPDTQWKYVNFQAPPTEISEEDRVLFEEMWGIPPRVQCMLEQEWRTPPLKSWGVGFYLRFQNLPDAAQSEPW
jgi:hypothetical protein